MMPYKTLMFYCNAMPTRRRQVTETLYRGCLKIPEDYNPPKWLNRWGEVGSIIYRTLTSPYSSLGYVNDWKEAFLTNKYLSITEVNILDLFSFSAGLSKIKEVDLVVILHSALGDSTRILTNSAEKFADRGCPLAVFIGNEYDLLTEKTEFLKQSNANYICSQLPLVAAKFLYGDIDRLRILAMPHGCNPKLYNSVSRMSKHIDFIFTGALYPLWLGDSERNDLVMKCVDQLACTNSRIGVGSGNVPREQWAQSLASAYGTIGAEAGTYFLDKNNLILTAAKKHYLKSNEPFDCRKYALENKIQFVSGKAISSRHFEALGTRTVQLLLEGNYNSILEPDVHYLSVKKDFSNLKDKISEFNDPIRRSEISSLGYELVMDSHTYAHRVSYMLKAIGI